LGRDARVQCTLRQLKAWLAELGLGEEEVALTAVELVKRREIQLVGHHADTMARLAGSAARWN
jgi:hypothetical protein